MLLIVISLFIMLASVALAAANFRSLARDTRAVVQSGISDILRTGRLAPNLAFFCLWLLIFGLSYV